MTDQPSICTLPPAEHHTNGPCPGCVRGTKIAAVRDYMANCNMGTENYWRHWSKLITYTDGIKLIADLLGAHWLIDVVASHQTTPSVQREWFQLWLLKPSGEHWVVEAWTDTPGEGGRNLVRQVIKFTDFPKELMPLRLYVKHSVLVLPEED